MMFLKYPLITKIFIYVPKKAIQLKCCLLTHIIKLWDKGTKSL